MTLSGVLHSEGMKQENVESHQTRNMRRPQVFEEPSGSSTLASKNCCAILLLLEVLMNRSAVEDF
jgi:hypothetical protein